MYKIVVIGGGTGSFTVLSGLKKYPNLQITALVTSFDSGGSSGRLRDEFGYLPVGDFRQALSALSNHQTNNLLRKLFNYRFTKGGHGLEGHNMGNLIMTALTDILGTEKKAISKIGSIFEINGSVHPITLERKITLVAQYQNGKVMYGEKFIDEPKADHDHTTPIARIWLDPQPKMNPQAKKVLLEADLIIFGPGDFYTSVMPNTLVSGFKETLAKSKAKTVFVLNLINKIGQTFGMSVKDYLEKFIEFTGDVPDFLLVNNSKLPKDLLQKYASEGSFPIEFDLPKNFPIKVIKTDLLTNKTVKTVKGDKLKRSLIRHDPQKLAKEIIKLLESKS